MICNRTVTTSTYDAANELLVQATGSTRVTYQYDNNGNQTQLNNEGIFTYYNWDVRNHLAAGEPVSGRVTYVYDGSNKRVKREQGSATIQYLYDGEKVLSETYGSNNLLHQYTSTNEQYGDLIRAYNGTSASYYQFNPQFSTEALLSQSGSVTDRMRYLAFGLGTQTQGSDTFENTFVGKKGYVWDATLDLYFMGPMARPYDPVAGRFTKEDSIGGYRSGWNLYEYCANDPINNIDPSGNDLFIQGQSTANNLKANLGDSGIIIKPVDLGPLKDGESNLYYAQLDPTTRPKIDALVNNTSERFWKKVGYGLAGATTKGAYTGLVSPIPGGFEIDEFDVSQLSPNQLELIFESDLATWGKDKAFDWSLGGAAHSAVLQELEKGPDFNPGLVPIEVLGELAQRGYAARARELGNLVILADYNPLGKGLIYFILGPRFLPTCSGEGVTALNLRAFYQVLDVIPVDNATSSPKEAIAQQKTAQNDFSIIRSYLSKDEQPSNFTSFAISLIPLHGLVDKILLPEKGRERDWFEGTISTLGDATWFLGPLTQATRKAFGLGGAAITKEVVSLTNIGIEGIVGSIRLYQSAENFWEGKESVAFGNLGEATLRLFGFSWSAIKFLKSRNKVIRNPEGAKTEAPKSVTPPKTLKASLESLSANDVGGYQKMMLKRKDINPDGWYDVVGHSTSEFFEISGKAESAEYLAQLIVQDPKFTGKVRLLSCLTGNPKVRPEVCGFDVSFAQRLANALKRETDGIRLTNPARKFEPIQVEATDGFYGARELPDGSIVHGHSPAKLDVKTNKWVDDPKGTSKTIIFTPKD